MPKSIASDMFDGFLRHQVTLQRLNAGERRTILKSLAGLREKLTAKLKNLDELTIDQSRRMTALFKTTDELIKQKYASIATQHRRALIGIGQYESEQTLEIANRTIGVSMLTVGVNQATITALVDDDIVMGAPAKEWWAKQTPKLQADFRDTIRRGVFAGETLNDLARRVRGTRERNFQDGIMAKHGRDAEILIRTSVQSIANAVRHETLQANDDVLQGQEWITALDPRVCPICIPLSGQAWEFDGKKLGETTQDFPGPPPLHFACRCTLVPALKSWEQLMKDAKGNDKLGRKLDRIERKLGKGTQSSMDGQIAADIDYETWLKGREKEEQQEVLGVGKWKLWKSGQIGLTDLVDERGRPLTLEELQESV